MGSMELNPEILKTSATIDRMEQNASVAAAALALTIVKITRNPAELMYSMTTKIHHDLFGPGIQKLTAGGFQTARRGCVDPSGKRNDADATLFRCDKSLYTFFLMLLLFVAKAILD